ncbi:MAG: SDR family oxidoreductase [Evtepia sp.]
MTEYMQNFSLEGQKAIVTGGAAGLCYAMAEGLHKAGAEVVLVDVSPSVEDSAAKLGAEGAPVHWVIGDLSQQDAIPQIYSQALDKLGGRLDILLNGAGIQFRCKAEDFPAERWNKIIDINLNAVFFLAQLAGRTMLDQGYGRIINVASMTSWFGSEMIPAYSASKGAVAQLTKALSNEWSGRGVNVNAIAPGYMVTKLTADMKEKNPRQYEEITGRIPMHRWGQPEDLQGTVVFLASKAASYVTGAIIPVDGGYLGK